MLCYRDETFCANKKCKKYKTCEKNYEKAIEERANEKDPFIRDLEVAICIYEECAEYGD